jgi:hypothetical protein
MQSVAKHLARFVVYVRCHCATRDASLRALSMTDVTLLIYLYCFTTLPPPVMLTEVGLPA